MSGLHWFSSYFIRKVFAKDICKSDELLIIISLTPCLTIVIRNRRDTEPECLRISWCLKSCGCSGSMALLDVRKNHSAIAYSCKERKKRRKIWFLLVLFGNCKADSPSLHISTPAGSVLFAQLQQAGLQLLCIVLEALGKGTNQTCCAAFVFHQLNTIPWKSNTHRLND